MCINKFSTHRFFRTQGGNVALSFALLIPAVAMLIGLAIEMASWENQKNHLQAAVDAAAIAGANELYLNGTTKSAVTSTVQAVGQANLGTGRQAQASFSAKLLDKDRVVHVNGSQARIQYLSSIIGIQPDPITAEAEARAVGGGRICVIGLDENAQGTIHLKNRARLTAKRCAVYSNSLSKSGLIAENSAVITTELLCSAGGSEGNKMKNFEPAPVYDCPKLDDPLRDRLPPSVSGCKAKKLVIKGKNTTLSPGTYCDGLTITKGANVKFSAGIYIIKDGEFTVTGDASIRGKYVGFYFEGKGSRLLFTTKSHIDLVAPKDGPMAGLLFFSERSTSKKSGKITDLKEFQITSDDASVLLGTIYLPNANLLIDAKKPVAEDSDYTVIVVRKLTLKEGPNLVINANYGDSDVPVPDGVGPVGSKIALIK